MTAAWEGAPWTPRAWQRKALPVILTALEQRKQGVVSAIMGAGKSILIAEVVAQQLTQLLGAVVVITPRQALVTQLAATLRARVGGEMVGVYYAWKKEPSAQVIVCCSPSAAALAGRLATLGRTVDLVIADEVHSTQADRVLEALTALDPAARVGFTATPYRAHRNERISAFDEVIYRYDMTDAIRDGVLVPFRAVHYRGGGSEAPTIDEAAIGMVLTTEGPGIVNATSIADAEQFAPQLCAAGVAAEAIHSHHSAAERTAKLERLRRGELRCLVHVALLSEGVDLPWLRWLALRRNVGSRVRFIQELGRVLRCHDGKSEALILDPRDLLGRMGLHHAEALGEMMAQAAAEEDDADDEMEEPESDLTDRPPERAALVGVITSWLRSCQWQLEMMRVPPPERYPPGPWQSSPWASDKQLQTIGKLGFVHHFAPPEMADGIIGLTEGRSALTKKAASELITLQVMLLRARDMVRQRRGQYSRPRWPAIDLPPPPDSELAALRRAAQRRARRRQA